MSVLSVLLAFAVAHSPATLKLHDGSTLNVTVAQDSLELTTRYGPLTIPLADVRSIDLGSHFADDTFPATLSALGDVNPKNRDAATKAAFAAGTAAFPFLVNAARTHEDPETKKRAEQLVSRLQAKFPAERLKADPDDVVSVVGSRFKGRLAGKALKVRSPHLGELTVKLADITEVRFRSTAATEIEVDAAKDGWQDSGVSVDRAARLSITASGHVELWPQQPGQYVSTPKGHETAGKGGLHKAGTLLGRVGENGRTFVVGEAFNGVPGEDGRLYLQVVGTTWNVPSVGSYAVKITLE